MKAEDGTEEKNTERFEKKTRNEVEKLYVSGHHLVLEFYINQTDH